MPKVALPPVNAFSRKIPRKMAGLGRNIGQFGKERGRDTKKGFIAYRPFFCFDPFLSRRLFLFCPLFCIDPIFVWTLFCFSPFFVLAPFRIDPYLFRRLFRVVVFCFPTLLCIDAFLYRTAFCIVLFFVNLAYTSAEALHFLRFPRKKCDREKRQFLRRPLFKRKIGLI